MPSDENYTRGDYVTLPSDNTNLETIFHAQDYLDVRTENDVYVNQLAIAQYAVFQFKNKHDNGVNPPDMTCVGISSLAPSISPVYMQVYNFTLAIWETLDTDSTTAANVKFTLMASLTSGLSDHHDAQFWYSFRIVQLIQ